MHKTQIHTHTNPHKLSVCFFHTKYARVCALQFRSQFIDSGLSDAQLSAASLCSSVERLVSSDSGTNDSGHVRSRAGCVLKSLQHDVLQVLLQDGVFNGVEDEADVLRVDGRGEVVEERLAAVAALALEALHQVVLDILQPPRVPAEVREVLADAHLGHLFHQQVHLVEEQDYGDVGEQLVVDNGLENVHGLHQAVGVPVLHQHLVVLAGRDHEEDGGDAVEALEPFLPLRALAAHVHHLEGDLFDDEVMLHYALGGLPGQEDVLKTWDIILFGTHKKIIKEDYKSNNTHCYNTHIHIIS